MVGKEGNEAEVRGKGVRRERDRRREMWEARGGLAKYGRREEDTTIE